MFKKKQPSSGQASTKTSVVVSSNKIKKFRLPSKRQLVAFLIVVVVLIGGGIGFLAYRHYQKPLRIGDQEFSRKDINDYLSYPVNKLQQDRQVALDTLIDNLKIKVAATKLKVQPTDQQVYEQYIKNKVSAVQAKEKWVQLENYVRAEQKMENDSDSTAYAGYLFVFYYGNKKLPDAYNQELPGFGDNNQILQDKSYAKNQADKYVKLLAGKKLTPQQALDQIKADPKLGVVYKANNNFSLRFKGETSNPWQQQVSLSSDIISSIKSQKASGLMPIIQTGKLPMVIDPRSDKDYTDAFYYFVYLDTAKPSLKDQLTVKVNGLKVQRYGL